MLPNRSPWIAQLKRSELYPSLLRPTSVDITIVGGGIAGISTAYFLLNMTNFSVALIEGDRLAHGATGHNGGQAVPYFERPFSDIVQTYGLEMACAAQKEILSTWDLLEDIYDTTNLKTPFHRFTGYAGCTTKEQILHHLENKYLRHKGGIDMEQIVIAAETSWLPEIPKRYDGLYSTAPHSHVLSLLETDSTHFKAALSTEKGALNSALFTEELAAYLLKQFPKRFSIYEGTKMSKVVLSKNNAVIETNHATLTSDQVVLCTNGFENFTIENGTGMDIDTRFHENIEGIVGYMAGYLEPLDKSPIAISYFTTKETEGGEIYYYLTRRPFELEQHQRHNLVCIGGPEVQLTDKRRYHRSHHEFQEQTLAEINGFLKKTYKPFPKSPTEYVFHWHGLMGYTRNILRLVGAEPCNKRLLYNLGCNGVGLLPSIAGGKRISRILSGDRLPKSIFDPVDTRCMIK